jgi:hypothetical protein
MSWRGRRANSGPAPAPLWRAGSFPQGRRGGWFGLPENLAAAWGQAAHQPVRLDRIFEPGLSPAVRDAGLNGAQRHLAAVRIEQRQLAARLRQATLQIAPLRFGWPQSHRRRLASITIWFLAHGQNPIQHTP